MASTTLPPGYYKPLNPKNLEIRVLSISPSNDPDLEIFCRLETESLNNSPSYNALSYCWGVEREGPVINVMGTKLAVKPNLFASLKQLRDTNDIVRLWVDAICINQSNTRERESQVSIMGLVYQRAKIVYAWLGEEADNSAVAMGLLQILQNILFGDSPDQIQLLRAEIFLAGWRALIPLLRRPYWTRAWIVQEILLAENVMFCCGRHKVAWPTIAALVSQVIPKWHAEAEVSANLDEGDPFSVGLGILQYFVYDFSHLSKLSFKHQELLTLSESNPASASGSLDLLDCLDMCRWRSVTDERDYIYSILSLANAKHIRPNYEKPAKWLFCEVVKRDIEVRGSLDILSGCKHFVEEERDSDKFSTAITDQLLRNEVVMQELTSGSTAPLPSVESPGIGQHPPWFERSIKFGQGVYETLISLAQEIRTEENIDSEHGRERDEPSFEVLSSLLASIRKYGQSQGSCEVLSHVEKFEIILQRFLANHRQSTLRRLLNASLPTWAPNWTLPLLTPRQNILLQDGSRELYQSAGSTTPRVRFYEGNRMIVEGILIDKVAHVPRAEANDPLQEYWDACSKNDVHPEIQYRRTGRLETFRQLLSLGRNKLSSFALQCILLKNDSLEEGQVQEEVMTEDELKHETCSVLKDWVGDANRQFFITSLGYYGAGPKSVREGDLIVILFGSKVPFLFRQNNADFYLIEECCKRILL